MERTVPPSVKRRRQGARPPLRSGDDRLVDAEGGRDVAAWDADLVRSRGDRAWADGREGLGPRWTDFPRYRSGTARRSTTCDGRHTSTRGGSETCGAR